MKRLVLPLWLVGGVLYTIGTLLLTNSIWSRDDNDPKPIATDVTSTSPAYPKVANVEPAETAPPQPEQFEPINPAAADKPHAITVEQAASAAPALANLPSPVPAQEQPPPAEARQAPANSIPNQAELLKVTSAASIRNGPSASADVIGTAFAGARVQVAARDSGWTQIVDPSSGNKGWIDATLLAPLTPPGDTASTEDFEQISEDETADALIESKPTPKAKKHRSNRHYGRRGFAIRFGWIRF
jgi:SH3 domain-containing protein